MRRGLRDHAAEGRVIHAAEWRYKVGGGRDASDRDEAIAKEVLVASGFIEVPMWFTIEVHAVWQL